MQVGPNDTLVVYGAAGGVGSMGVQIGRARGARVIGTASKRNHDYLSALGVEPVAYDDGPVGRIRELAPDGVTRMPTLLAASSRQRLRCWRRADGTSPLSTIPSNSMADS